MRRSPIGLAGSGRTAAGLALAAAMTLAAAPTAAPGAVTYDPQEYIGGEGTIRVDTGAMVYPPQTPPPPGTCAPDSSYGLLLPNGFPLTSAGGRGRWTFNQGVTHAESDCSDGAGNEAMSSAEVSGTFNVTAEATFITFSGTVSLGLQAEAHDIDPPCDPPFDASTEQATASGGVPSVTFSVPFRVTAAPQVINAAGGSIASAALAGDCTPTSEAGAMTLTITTEAGEDGCTPVTMYLDGPYVWVPSCQLPPGEYVATVGVQWIRSSLAGASCAHPDSEVDCGSTLTFYAAIAFN